MPTDPTPPIQPHSPEADWPDEENYYDDEYDPGEECGRWIDGRLGRHCALAGTEFCEWECPYRVADAPEPPMTSDYADLLTRLETGKNPGSDLSWQVSPLHRAAAAALRAQQAELEHLVACNRRWANEVADLRAALARQSALIPQIQEAERAVGRREAEAEIVRLRSALYAADDGYRFAHLYDEEHERAISQQEPANGG